MIFAILDEPIGFLCQGEYEGAGPGGCGKCVLVKNTNSAHPDWTAVVMKKNRCPPWSHGCGAGSVHMDIAVPAFLHLPRSAKGWNLPEFVELLR